jgi:sec-independent protein translocase protein TatB
MFDVGFSEIVLIFIIALIVLGPERLPGLARTAGYWLGKARRMLAEVKSEIEREMQVDEIKRSIREVEHAADIKKLAERVQSINSDVQGVITDVTTPPAAAPTNPPAPPAASHPPSNSSVK